MRQLKIAASISFLFLLLIVACTSPEEEPKFYPTPTFAFDINQNRSPDIEIITIEQIIDATAVPFDYTSIDDTEEEQRKATVEAIQRVNITIDTEQIVESISPYIYGISLADSEVVNELQPSVYSWTGDGTVRYNIKTGRGWNEGRETLYKNANPFPESDNYALDFLALAESVNAKSSFSLPTIGWGAKDTSSCSFPDIELGNCTRGFESTCFSGNITGNPTQTSIPLTANDIVDFIQEAKASGQKIDFIPLLYEPELWGIIHYDLHPECVTYAEILDLYTTYASAIRDEVPDAELMGPGTCCYEFYFNSPAGEKDKAKHDDTDFIPWFLQSMREYDEAAGKRHLDVLDIHYYPQDLSNDFDDPVIASHRLRAPRSLFDPLYADESYIREPIQLIPRMQGWIDEHYPDTKLAISAWNFGAPNSLSGALAIAEVLGIYGREGLYFASYFPGIEENTPAYYAFKIFTNYDDNGGKFGNLALEANSSHPDEVSVYSSIDSETGNLHIILINRVREFIQFETEVVWDGFESTGKGAIYTFASDLTGESARITGGPTQMGVNRQIITLPNYSITHMILEPVPERDSSQE